jgi:hypothetical protein
MRALQFHFHPERIRVSPEEILADLRYPARQAQPTERRKTSRRRRGRG